MIFQGSFRSLTFRGGPTVPLPPAAPPGCGEGLASLSPAARGLHGAGTPHFPLLFLAGLLTKCKVRRVAAWKLYVFGAVSVIGFLVLISIMISERSQVVLGLCPAAPAAGRGKKGGSVPVSDPAAPSLLLQTPGFLCP